MVRPAHSAHVQLHMGLGLISGTYAGATTNSISVPQGLNVEYETFVNTTRSYLVRSQLAVDQTTGKLVYYGTFAGGRYYFKSTGMILENDGDEVTLSSIPKWRYYYGWDIGISQVVVDEVGPALTVVSSLLDMGGHIGGIYQLGSTWGFGAQLGYSYGWGFSTVAVTGTTMKIVFGGVYYFR